jgi:hypothetical protein
MRALQFWLHRGQWNLLTSKHLSDMRNKQIVDSTWNVMAHGDVRDGKWRENWRKKWVTSSFHTTSEHGISNITTAEAHTSAASSRLNWRPRLFNHLNAELNPIWHLLVLLGDLTFMGPCIVSIPYSNIRVYPSRCNVTQFIYTWKLLYMFRVVLPPIIGRAYNCIYSIWYLSHRYCYLPLSWKSWNRFECAVGGVGHPQHTQTGSNW